MYMIIIKKKNVKIITENRKRLYRYSFGYGYAVNKGCKKYICLAVLEAGLIIH